MKDMSALEEKFKNYLYDNTRVELFSCKEFKLLSSPDEALADFKSRILDLIREDKDKAVEKLTEQYAKKEEKLEKEFIKLQEKLEKEEADVKTLTTQSALSLGSSVLGALLGRTKVGTLSTGVTGLSRASRIMKEKKDVELVKKKIEALSENIQKLEDELKQSIESMAGQFDIDNYTIETISIKPKKSDIFGISVALLWETE
jgi:CRISPR/Cas system CMR subunit Cmr6 (Cas7 group RAMP superfamily)